MIRRIVNAYGDWLVSDGDAFDFLTRIASLVLVILVAVVGLAILMGACIATFGGTEKPSLFCADGTQIATSPATRVVGKVSKSGVVVTCS